MQTPQKQVYQIRLPLPFRLNHVNSYLIQDEEGWSVIDPGLKTPDTEALWIDVLRQFNLSPSDIKRIFITHYHPDHYGFAGAMQQWTGGILLATSATFALANQYYRNEQVEENWSFYRSCGIPEPQCDEMTVLDRELLEQISTIAGESLFVQEGDSFLLGGIPYVTVVGGGHAEGSIGFWNEEKRLLIGGDLLLERITPNITFRYEDEQDPLQQYLDTLIFLRQRNIHTVLPGHGAVFHPQPGYIDRILAHHHERLDKILALFNAAGAKALTPFEVCARLFPGVVHPESIRFALGETVAHLRYLQTKNLLQLQEESHHGLYYFSKA